jgi:myxalamid-type polyketide synthase MxaE and MxaD
MHPLPNAAALALLGDLIVDGASSQVAVAAVDWSVLKPMYEARRPRPFLALLSEPGAAHRRTRRDAPPVLALRLADAPAGARREIVVEFLCNEVGLALGIANASEIDTEQGLFEMGMDSLMSVELKSRLESALGTSLPSTLTFNYPNIESLAGYIVSDSAVPAATILSQGECGNEFLDGAAPDATSTEDLSEDDLAALLASRLSKLQR